MTPIPAGPAEKMSKKEEAERQEREEEELALLKQREEEELKKLMKQRAEAAERYQRYMKTQPLREAQKAQTNLAWNNLMSLMDSSRKNYREQLWWKRYLYESDNPNPLEPKETNTFISLWESSMNSLKKTVEQNLKGLKVIDDIYFTEFLYPDVSASVRNSWCQQITELENLMENNIKLSTLSVLKNAVKLFDIKTGNLQYENKQETTALLLWWNVSKNPKYRSFSFVETGVSFEVPKLMVMMDCVFQMRYTSYDHLSHYCHSYLTRTAPFLEKPEVIGPPPPLRKKHYVVKPQSLPDETTTSTSVSATTGSAIVQRSSDGLREVSGEVMGESTTFIPRPEAPCPLGTVGIADTCSTNIHLYLANEEIEFLPEELNLREMWVLGGIWHVGLLAVPPQPVKIEKWWLREEVPNILHEFYYNFNFSPPIYDKEAVAPGRGGEEDDGSAEREANQRKAEMEKLVLVNIPLPNSSVLLMETEQLPVLARWDAMQRCWTTQDVHDVKYDEEQRMFSFRLAQFGFVALLQNRFLTLPYQSWFLQPISKDVIKFTLQTAVVAVEFHVTMEGCVLTQLTYSEELHLKDLYHKPMSAKLLLKAILSYGVNFFPEHDAYKYIEPTVKLKDWNLEQEVYKNLALACMGYEFGSSRWSSSVGSRKVVVKLREHITTKIKGPQYLILINLQETMILQSVETSQEFTEEPLPDQDFYLNIYHLVLLAGSMEAKTLVEECPPAIVDGVYYLLLLTKPLSFCQ